MGKIVGKFRKILEKNRNIVGIFQEIPKKSSKNSREKCRVFPWLEEKFPMNLDKIQKIQIKSGKFR